MVTTRNINALLASLKIGNVAAGEYFEVNTVGQWKQHRPDYDDLRVAPMGLPLVGSHQPKFEIVVNDGSVTTGYALVFNGTDSNGSVPYYSDMNTTNLSIAVWISPDTVSQEEIIDRDTAGGFEFYISNGRLYFSPTGGASAQTGSYTVIGGATQFLVVTANEEGANLRIKLYIDGNMLQETVVNDTLDTTAIDGYLVGQYHGGGWNFDGIMDEIKVYNVVLTDAQIAEMYNNGEGIGTEPTGITEATDLIAYFKDSLTNESTLGATYDMVGTNITIVDGLVGVTTGSFGVPALAFYPDVLSEIFFSAQLPHRYMEGGDIYPHPHWMCKDDTTGNALWGLEYTWVNVYGSVANTTIVENAIPVPAQGVHAATDIAELDGTGKTISSIIQGRLYRDGTNALDTLNSIVYMSEFDFHIPVNTAGSESFWIK